MSGGAFGPSHSGCHVLQPVTDWHCLQHQLPTMCHADADGWQQDLQKVSLGSYRQPPFIKEWSLLINCSRSVSAASQWNTNLGPRECSCSIFTSSYNLGVQQLPLFSTTFLTSAAGRGEMIPLLFLCLINHCRTLCETQRLCLNTLVQWEKTHNIFTGRTLEGFIYLHIASKCQS